MQIEPIEKTNDHIEYLGCFKEVVLGGIACGLQHPVEWIMNYTRHVGVSYTDVPKREKLIKKVSAELFQYYHLEKPKSDDDVVKWINKFYAESKPT